MSCEVRRVPVGWQHPRFSDGTYVPLFDGAKFADDLARWNKDKSLFAQGLWEINGKLEPLPPSVGTLTFEEWEGRAPNPADYTEVFCEDSLSSYVLYETVSEGTPISPTFETHYGLAEWLAQQTGQPYDVCERFCRSADAHLFTFTIKGNSP